MVRARVVGAALQTQAGLNRRLGSRADMFGGDARDPRDPRVRCVHHAAPVPRIHLPRDDDVAFSSTDSDSVRSLHALAPRSLLRTRTSR